MRINLNTTHTARTPVPPPPLFKRLSSSSVINWLTRAGPVLARNHFKFTHFNYFNWTAVSASTALNFVTTTDNKLFFLFLFEKKMFQFFFLPSVATAKYYQFNFQFTQTPEQKTERLRQKSRPAAAPKISRSIIGKIQNSTKNYTPTDLRNKNVKWNLFLPSSARASENENSMTRAERGEFLQTLWLKLD